MRPANDRLRRNCDARIPISPAERWILLGTVRRCAQRALDNLLEQRSHRRDARKTESDGRPGDLRLRAAKTNASARRRAGSAARVRCPARRSLRRYAASRPRSCSARWTFCRSAASGQSAGLFLRCGAGCRIGSDGHLAGEGGGSWCGCCPFSPAAMPGLKCGDRILAINHQLISRRRSWSATSATSCRGANLIAYALRSDPVDQYDSEPEGGIPGAHPVNRCRSAPAVEKATGSRKTMSLAESILR